MCEGSPRSQGLTPSPSSGCCWWLVKPKLVTRWRTVCSNCVRPGSGIECDLPWLVGGVNKSLHLTWAVFKTYFTKCWTVRTNTSWNNCDNSDDPCIKERAVASRSGKWFCRVEAPSFNFCKDVKLFLLSQRRYSTLVKCLALRRTQTFTFGDVYQVLCETQHNCQL
jgi:hypothetical protein